MHDFTNPTPLSSSPELEELVEELMRTTGSLSLIVNQLLRCAVSGTAPDDEPVPDTLRRLLTSVLGPIVQRHGPQAIARAAAIVSEARELVCEQIFAVADLGQKHLGTYVVSGDP
jgi:hypothetical protein